MKYNKSHDSTSKPFPAALLSAAGNGKIHASAWIFVFISPDSDSPISPFHAEGRFAAE